MSRRSYPIGIGILCYKEPHEAVRLIKSIQASTANQLYSLCVRDNTDEGPSFAQAWRSECGSSRGIAILHDGRNVGCAVARNQIWEYFRKNCPTMRYIVIMDQDVVVGYNWLQDMVEVAEAHPDAGQVAWPIFNLARETPLPCGRIHNVASGASLYRMAAVKATNGWDERFFFYRFDSWFTLLSYSLGWPTYMVTKYGKPKEDWKNWTRNHGSGSTVFCGPMKHVHPHHGVKRHPRCDEIKAESQILFDLLLQEHGLTEFYTKWPTVDPLRPAVSVSTTTESA